MTEQKRFYHRTSQFLIDTALLLLVLFFALLSSCSTFHKSNPKAIVLSNTPFNMPEIRPPVFPDRSFDIRSYGAVGDGKTKNTKAFADAVDVCTKVGGGRVVVPAGIWFTGKIHLKSNVNLHIEKGAEIRFSTDPNDYLPVVFTRWAGVECYNYSPLIYANNCNNVAITGPGRINGQGQAWWYWAKVQGPAYRQLCAAQSSNIAVKDRVLGTPKDALRPQLINFINCRNVLFEDFTAVNSPFWNTHLVYCQNVTISSIRLENPHEAPNGDGLDLDSCNNVLVENLYADVGDDGICLKSGRDEDGWRVGRACENIVIRNCQIKKGHGGFVIGSEMSGGIRNVFVNNCHFSSTYRGIRLKSRRGRGGVVENVYVQNITMDNITTHAILLNMFYKSGPKPLSKKPGIFRNIHLKNITCRGARDAVGIFGLPEKLIENVTLENVSIFAKRGAVLTDAKNIKLINVNIKPDVGAVMKITDSRDVTIRDSTCPADTDIFLKLAGGKTRNINLSNNDLSNTNKQIVLGDDVPSDAVLRK